MTFDPYLEIEQAIQDAFDEVVDWNHEFGTTIRRNGETIYGNPRDTTDEAKINDSLGFANSFTVEQADLNGIVISSDDDSANAITRFRPELEDWILEFIDPEDIIGSIIVNHFKGRVL